MGTNLEAISALVSEHRRKKGREPYTAQLWESVSALRNQYSVQAISRATGLCPSLIYKRGQVQSVPKVPRAKRMFQEVKLVETALVIKPIAVEVRRSDGALLRFNIEGKSGELTGLFQEFLR
jgi:transposase-like protein